MRISTRFSDAIHLLAFIHIYQDIKLTSDVIAASIQTSPVVVRRLTSTLRQAKLITNHAETNQIIVARQLDNISLFDIFLVTEGHADLFTVDKETNPLCIVGGNIQEVLHDYYEEAQTAAYAKLNQITLQNVVDQILIRHKVKESIQTTTLRNELV